MLWAHSSKISVISLPQSSCPPTDSALTANSTQPSPHTDTHTQSSYFHLTHRLVGRFLTVCQESPSVAVTATIRPPKCALPWPHTNLLLPGDALLQSQTDIGNWLSLCPMISRLRSEWRRHRPITAFKHGQALHRHQKYFWQTTCVYNGEVWLLLRDSAGPIAGGKKHCIRPQPRKTTGYRPNNRNVIGTTGVRFMGPVVT